MKLWATLISLSPIYLVEVGYYKIPLTVESCQRKKAFFWHEEWILLYSLVLFFSSGNETSSDR